MKKFRTFSGPHQVTRTIDDKRVATAWIGEHAIWGGEATTLTKDVGPTSQFHPATVQWRTPSGKIGWVQLTRAPNLNATADHDGITIETKGDVTFRIAPTASWPPRSLQSSGTSQVCQLRLSPTAPSHPTPPALLRRRTP